MLPVTPTMAAVGRAIAFPCLLDFVTLVGLGCGVGLVILAAGTAFVLLLADAGCAIDWPTPIHIRMMASAGYEKKVNLVIGSAEKWEGRTVDASSMGAREISPLKNQVYPAGGKGSSLLILLLEFSLLVEPFSQRTQSHIPFLIVQDKVKALREKNLGSVRRGHTVKKSLHILVRCQGIVGRIKH